MTDVVGALGYMLLGNGVIAFISLVGILTLIFLRLIKKGSFLKRIILSLCLAVFIPLLMVFAIGAMWFGLLPLPKFLIDAIFLGFVAGLWYTWWILPLIFSILLAYSSITWIMKQRKKKKTYLWFLFGIAGMFLWPILYLFIPRIMSGEANWLGVLTASILFVIIPFGLFFLFPLYLIGLLTGALMGFSIEEGIKKTFKSKLWAIMATITVAYQGIYINLLNHTQGVNPSYSSPGFENQISTIIGTILLAIAGAFIGWLITKLVFMRVKGGKK